jgi:tripartite-type tricarboxylate transporter receptor subunit TctC
MTSMTMLKAFAAAAAATTLLVGPVSAADDYPTRGVTWAIPFGAGGGTDRLSRLFVAESERIVGQTLTVENHAGAGGVTGWSHVLSQPADGYTIFNASPTPVITLLTEEEPPFEPTEIEIIGYIGAFASILVVREDDFPDWDSFVAAAAERPITIGGTNSTLLGAANTLSQAGVDVIYVSYSSTGEAVTDFLGGHIDATATTESTAATIVPENGIALINTSSIPLSADMDEALGGNVLMSRDLGYNGLAFPRWVGMHPDTPEEILAAAAEMVGKIAMDPVVQESWTASGEPIVYLNREEAAADYAALVEALRRTVELID